MVVVREEWKICELAWIAIEGRSLVVVLEKAKKRNSRTFLPMDGADGLIK